MTTSKPEPGKRHCMVVHAHYPAGETRVQRQAEMLARHGYQVDVLCLRGRNETAHEMCNGVQVIRLPVRYRNYERVTGKLLEYVRFFLLAMFKVAQLHLRRPYRTLQLHNLPDFLVFAAWIPKLLGARVILDLHDLMPEFYQARFGGDDTRPLIRLVYLQERLACRFADHVVTVSEVWRQRLIGRGLPTDKCSVVMNVADHTVFNQSAGPKVVPADTNGLHLIYHGSVSPGHGIDLVLQAVAQVRDRIPAIRLTIHGGGEYLPGMMALAGELGILDQHVHFSTNPLPVSELPNLLRSADLGLAPYRGGGFTGEIVPTKLMEYAALGMPAIASRTVGIEAYFRDTNVEFFTPGDANDLARCILTLHADRERLAELVRGAERFNRAYNWEKLGGEYVALVEQLGCR